MIQSHLIDNCFDGLRYLFYDTVLDGKHVFTACGMGKIEGTNVLLSPAARQGMVAATGHVQNLEGTAFRMRFQEIASIDLAGKRVGDALDAANDKELIFFVCRSPDIYDAAIAALNVQWTFPGGVQ